MVVQWLLTCSQARRFLRTPVVGSLNQLRAELLLRYSAKHYWVAWILLG
jgi:hypothetical protein